MPIGYMALRWIQEKLLIQIQVIDKMNGKQENFGKKYSDVDKFQLIFA